jgi:hypothetical protein
MRLAAAFWGIAMVPRHSTRALAVAGLCMSLGACSTMSGALFPEKPKSPVPAASTATLPNAGTSFFAPVPVAPGANTGTPQSAKINELRGRLVALQGEVSARNANLSELRQRAAGEGALYRIAKSDSATTTPPNPQALQKAQGALDRFSAATAALDGEMRIFARGAAEANKLMNESLAIRESSEADQAQLNTLRGEITQTANQLDALVNEISNEWALQSAFLAKERASLAAVGVTPTASVTLPPPAVASAAMLSQPAFVTIKFDRANVSYRDALANAVSQAKRRKPDATFDVIGVAAGPAITPAATARAQEVANMLATLGVDATRIRIFSAAGAGQRFSEVRIHAR